VAPGTAINHNETDVLAGEIALIEELEAVIAPINWRGGQHNETVILDEEIELNVEVLEEIVAPQNRSQSRNRRPVFCVTVRRQ